MAATKDGDDDIDGDDDDDKGSDCEIITGTPMITALIPIDRTPYDSIMDRDEKGEINDPFEGIASAGVRTIQWELAERLTESLPKVSEAFQGFVRSSLKGSKAYREFAGSLLGVHRERAEGDRELAKMASGVH
ncbi:hypothetical protein B296_00018878 [Ensete ventricosum]|uniref:Uncharacterized protein n=1 Tax=Ensete ventricosum TaxID=4639 RepID=A0A427A2M5_ENSVE|nr:hypothetical protein B296_00018878 [Ensete ventricosum]